MDTSVDTSAHTVHPLDPLTSAEIALAAEAVRAGVSVPGEMRFETIELKDPTRAELRAYRPGDPVARAARVNVYTTGQIGVWRCLVDLKASALVSVEHLADKCPMIMLEEFDDIESAVKADPRFQAACAKRGLTDMDLVCVDPWSGGNFGHEDEAGRHIAHTFAWVRTRPFDNQYAHPIEGVNAVVDVKTMEVLRVDDHAETFGLIPTPMQEANYDARFGNPTRSDLKPIDVVQPEGVSFALEGSRLTWADWSMHLGFNAREGLTLHDVQVEGRPVLFRAALSEMVVPYGSPHPGHARKNVFDIGEYGIGKLANALKLGCDCLGTIQYVDAWLSGIDGKPYKIPNAICIHEEDYGVLWKHWDFRTDHTEVRRARRLVVSFIATVGNYEYGSYWYLYLDGTVEFEMKATGIINTVACLPGQPSVYGTEVSPGVEGQIHQHCFCVKLDMAVDGDANSVVEIDTERAPPGPENPYRNAFFARETRLETETGRQAAPERQRFWKFINPGEANRVGKPTGYKLEPQHSLTNFLDPMGPSGQRGTFADNHLWVTASHPDERYPAGEFMNHSDGSDSVAAYAAKGRSIDNTAITAWHTFGLHHLPRLEDYPVQPCMMVGFKLMPSGFFSQNPGMSVPPEVNKASRSA